MYGKVVGVALAATLLATPVLAAPITLKFNSPAPPPSFLHNNVFRPWIKNVEKASKGTLKIQLYVGGTLGNFKVNYDRVVDGVADIGFILTAFTDGKFKKLDVAELPFQSKNSTEAAYSLWKLYAKGLANDEFDQVKPLAIWTFPNAALHTKKKITSLEDVKGMRIATSNVSTSNIVKLVGRHAGDLHPAGHLRGDQPRHRRRRADAVHRHAHLQDQRGDQPPSRRAARRRHRADVHEQEEVRFAAARGEGGDRQVSPTCRCRRSPARRPTPTGTRRAPWSRNRPTSSRPSRKKSGKR